MDLVKALRRQVCNTDVQNRTLRAFTNTHILGNRKKRLARICSFHVLSTVLKSDYLEISLLMFNIVLYEPEIPPNTGNIIRLCANVGALLHLIEPIAFSLDDKSLRRAGLDYDDMTRVTIHKSYAQFLLAQKPRTLFACSTRGTKNYSKVNYSAGDYLLFGPETRGLPQKLLHELSVDHVLRLPMQPNNRSLNLSNTVAIVVYEAWRQNQFSA